LSNAAHTSLCVVRHAIKVGYRYINSSIFSNLVPGYNAKIILTEMAKIPKSNQSQNTSRSYTSQINKRANTGHLTCRRWDQVLRSRLTD
jgi:ribosomal protein L33